MASQHPTNLLHVSPPRGLKPIGLDSVWHQLLHAQFVPPLPLRQSLAELQQQQNVDEEDEVENDDLGFY